MSAPFSRREAKEEEESLGFMMTRKAVRGIAHEPVNRAHGARELAGLPAGRASI